AEPIRQEVASMTTSPADHRTVPAVDLYVRTCAFNNEPVWLPVADQPRWNTRKDALGALVTAALASRHKPGHPRQQSPQVGRGCRHGKAPRPTWSPLHPKRREQGTVLTTDRSSWAQTPDFSRGVSLKEHPRRRAGGDRAWRPRRWAVREAPTTRDRGCMNGTSATGIPHLQVWGGSQPLVPRAVAALEDHPLRGHHRQDHVPRRGAQARRDQHPAQTHRLDPLRARLQRPDLRLRHVDRGGHERRAADLHRHPERRAGPQPALSGHQRRRGVAAARRMLSQGGTPSWRGPPPGPKASTFRPALSLRPWKPR